MANVMHPEQSRYERFIAYAETLKERFCRRDAFGTARLASAVAETLEAAIPKETPDMIIDAPFLVWFMRPLLNKPLFVGYIATEDWKNPGSIH